MLIQGTPDILKPPATPFGMSGLDAVPRSDAGTAANLRSQFVQQYGQAALDRFLSVWQSDAPDWEIIERVRQLDVPGIWRASGVQFDDFYAWWNTSLAQLNIRQTFFDTGLYRSQKGQTIRFVIANTPGFTTEQAAAAVGMTNIDFVAWLEGSDAEYATTAKAIMAAPLSEPQKAQMLESLAYKMGLSVTDLARYLGMTNAQVSALLSQAVGVPTYAGGGIVAQSTATQPGAALVGDVLALIPAGSSRVVDAVGNGAGGVTVTTADGVTAEIAPGAAGLRTVPITPQAWGRLEALQTSTALDYQAQSIAIYRALQEIGVTDPAELNSWIPAGLDTVLQWLQVQGQTVVVPIESIGIQAPSFSQDAALNQQFAAIFNDANRSRTDKARAWVDLMRANGLGLNDVSRIVGVDARSVAEFLSSTDLAKSAEVPQLIAIETDSFIDYATPQDLFVPVYTRQVAPTGRSGEIPIFSGDLVAMTASQRAAEYLRLIDLGWADSQIRDAVTLDYGAQADADWVALRNLAAAQRAAEVAAKAAADAAAAAQAAAAQAATVVQQAPQSSAAATTAQAADQVLIAAAVADNAAQVAVESAGTAAAAADAGDSAGSVQASATAISASDVATNANSNAMETLIKAGLVEPPYSGPGDEFEIPVNTATTTNVTQAYRSILKREPDAAGLDFYTTGGFTIEQVIADMKASPEYRGVTVTTPPPAVGGGVAPLLLAVAAAYILGA